MSFAKSLNKLVLFLITLTSAIAVINEFYVVDTPSLLFVSFLIMLFLGSLFLLLKLESMFTDKADLHDG